MMIRNTRLHILLLAMSMVGPGAMRTALADNLWASHSLEKVLRTTSPGPEAGRVLELCGTRGERVSGQAVFRPSSDVLNATVTISELFQQNSLSAIPRHALRLQWVRYIDVARNSAGVPDDELVARAPTSLPDPFWEVASLQVPANQAQPIWIEIDIPRDATAGDYQGVLEVRTATIELSLPVRLHVWDFEMPSERHLSVINWGVFPGQTYARRLASGEADYFELYREYCEFLVAHRQTDLMGSLDWIERVTEPESDRMFDTSRLQLHAEVAFAAGIRQIHLHAAGHKTASILDAAGRVEVPEREGGPQRISQLKALQEIVEQRGWQDRFLVAVTDEPFIHHEESFAAAVETVREAAPSVRTVEAVETEYLGNLDVYVPKLSHLNLWYPHFQTQRLRQGNELWFYTCCHPTGRYPNRFLDQSLLKVRVLHWLNYLYDLDGYLHWGLNFYGSDEPFSEDGISKDLPLGDRAIVYPGEASILGSLRFSAQRDGLQDYEYLWVLSDRLEQLKGQVGEDAFWLDPRQRPLELCRRVVWSFHDHTRDPEILLATRRTIAEEIESLRTAPLLVVQTSPPEGTAIPAGPRMINVRGLVAPGAKVFMDDSPVPNVRPSGYFAHYCFLGDNPRVTITVEHEGQRRSIQRTFQLVD